MRVTNITDKNDCIMNIPWAWEKTKATVRAPRKVCLASGWAEVEDNTIKELMKNSDLTNPALNESDYRSYILKIKSDVQTRIEKKYF